MAASQPPQQVVIKQGPGCLKIGLIVVAVLFLFGIIGVACLAFAGNEVAKEINRSMGTADSSDYELSDVKCDSDGSVGVESTGTITNTAERSRAFQIVVRWETTDGVLITEDSTFTDTLKVDQSQAWKNTTFTDAPEGSEATCEVVDVRYSIFENADD